MTQAPASDDRRDRVSPTGAHRPVVAELREEVERLTAELRLAEQRRRTAEQTLAEVARSAAADAALWRGRLAELEAAPALEAPASAPSAPLAPAAPRRRPRWKRPLLATGMAAGVLLIADGVVTIAWQEPLTRLEQSHAQHQLRGQLRQLDRVVAAAPHLRRETVSARMRRAARMLLHARPDGSALGSIVIPRIGLKSVFVESTGHDALSKGPGHYRGTMLPGLDGTTAIAGHRTTYGAPFRHVDALKPGSRIVLNMPYGTFTYRVIGTRITVPSDTSSLRSHPGQRRLVLTACHPLYSAAKRIIVTARLASARPA